MLISCFIARTAYRGDGNVKLPALPFCEPIPAMIGRPIQPHSTNRYECGIQQWSVISV